MKFQRHFFRIDGMYLNYGLSESTKQFVARFKYSRGDRASFTKFLIANFTVEEYFSRLNAGETPVGILRSKGWVSPMVAKLKSQQAAYEQNQRLAALDAVYIYSR